jgi:hypothetical protein
MAGLTRPALLACLALLAASAWAQQDDEWEEDDWGDDEWEEAAPEAVELHGLVETALGARVVPDPAQPGDFVLNEARFRLAADRYSDRADLSFRGDAIADAATDEIAFDVRRALVSLRPHPSLTVRAGRQVMTWGTGDLVFLNDLFPKDFVAFFAGRDVEFLKAPANAVRATLYLGQAGLDVAWMPRFTPDRYLTGERLSYFSPLAGTRVGAGDTGGPFRAALPEQTVENGEVAMRLYRPLGSFEVAGYGYVGFTKQPVAFDPALGVPTFSRLSVVGASVRGPLLGGISNAEFAYHDAPDDRDGDDPFVPNGQFRLLVGHERELRPSLTLGLQYYAEHTRHHGRLLAASPAPAFEPNEVRHLLTSRWTVRARQQTLTWSLFTFWSPSGGDGHLRPSVGYAWSDAVELTAGSHVFFGPRQTLFGQLEDNTSVYARARYTF